MKKFNLLIVAWMCLGSLCLKTTFLQAQTTVVAGTVVDAATQEPLAFVNISFQNTSIGTSSDLDGRFELTTEAVHSKLLISYVGYQDKVVDIKVGTSQELNIKLESSSTALETVTVKAKKQRYSKKNNPAVDLMRQVIQHKKKNGLNGYAFYQYDQHEKVEVDINHLDEKVKDRKLLRAFDVVWNYLDSTDQNQPPMLPVLMREKIGTVYHRSNPNTTRTHIQAYKLSKLKEFMAYNNLNTTINVLYQDVDIYENNIILLRNQFLSPLAPVAIDFYRFYIVDTLEVLGQSAINMSFIPKNQSNFGFTGNLYISNDGKYQVLKVEMGIFGNLNLNFVRDINIEQEFQSIDSTFLLKKNKVSIDYALTEDGIGMYGTKTVFYDHYQFEPPADLSVFDGVEQEIIAVDAEEKSNSYWTMNRLDSLSSREAGIYQMVDTLKTIPSFKRFQKISNFLISGYVPAGKVDIGPYATIGGFNSIEGFRLKLGGETNFNFSKKILLQAYAAYGFKDKAYKYAVYAYYSFNEDYLKNPRHYLHLSYVKETGFPGLEQQFINENNFLLSFKWGATDKMLLSNTFKASYVKETESFAYGLSFTNNRRRPYGQLVFEQVVNDTQTQKVHITTSEIGLDIRFAPNQQFFIRGKYRYPIYNKYPIFTARYDVGINGFLGGEYSYHRLTASIFKRFEMSILGHSNVEVTAGKVFGQVPYILMHIPVANQTYAYRTNSYNLMSFMEFVGDEYINVNFRHYFKGFFFNRIPLIKKLEWREVLSAKLIWGRVSDKNNPILHPELVQFPLNDLGQPTTYALAQKPYIELGFGISNIAKFFRVDVVKRLTYLDHPYVPTLWNKKGWGLRFRFDVEF